MQPEKPKQPVIVLAFSNEFSEQGFLRQLTQEMKDILNALERTVQKGRVHLKLIPAASQEEISEVFQEEWYEERISIFHYGGHADEDELWLEDEGTGNRSFFSIGLARFLGAQKGLRLVFLNGCATEEHAQLLLEAGIPAVIATSRKIPDIQARQFAETFYKGLASGVNISEAFAEAEGIVLGQTGDIFASPSEGADTRSLFWEDTEADKKDFPWRLYIKEGAEVMVELWRLFYELKESDDQEDTLGGAAFVGKDIGNYEVKELLGEGSFGYVFAAMHKSLNKEVAIKVSHRVKSGYDALRQVIFSGNKGLGSLRHPNIVGFFDAGEWEIFGQKRLYVVMEWVKGERLDKLDLGIPQLRGKEFRALTDLAIQLCDGLEAAHNATYEDASGMPRKGFIHGNIHPKKILFTPDGVPKIIDFLFMDLAGNHQIELAVPESVKTKKRGYNMEDYYPPEVVSGQTTVNEQTDIFALGATFIKTVTGKGLSEIHYISMDELHGIIRQQNRHFPKNLTRVLFRAVHPKPASRYPNMGEMKADLLKQSGFWKRLRYRIGLR